MDNKGILNRLMSFLATVSDEDLRLLADFLEQPKTREALAGFIRSALELRSSERDLSRRSLRRSRAGKMLKKLEPTGKVARNGYDEDQELSEIESSLEMFLNDREVFPSIWDLVESVNQGLGCKVKYEDFQKRGRRDLIAKCLAYLRDYPEGKRRDLLRSFLSTIKKEPSATDQYQRLFKILVRDE